MSSLSQDHSRAHYRVVIIGGGVVGASVLYHLAKLGWTDVALIERSVLTAGSSWHAAGGVHALNADPNMAALQAYTIDLLSEIEKESGQDIGLHMTGGITVASVPERWEWLQAAYRIFQTIGIEDCHLMTPEEIREKCPIMDVTGVIGGLWADREGYLDTTGTVHAYAGAARKRGATVIEHNKVEALNQRADGTWEVTTEKGVIHAEHVVNAGGLWAKQVGRMVGLDLPLSPLQHHYLVTETIPEVAALDFEVPMTVDLEGFTYIRQDQQGMLVGIYEVDHKHWNIDGAPWDYGFDLIPEEIDRIAGELEMAWRRYPVLERVGVKRWVNGAFTFSPDGNPLVGPVPGLRNYWLACGVMAGFLQGGGVGKSLAEWMIHGEAEADVWPMDIARYGPFTSNREYIRQTTGQFYSRRFVMTYPNEQLPAGRPLRKAPAHDAMTRRGLPVGLHLGAGDAARVRAPGFRGDADAQALERLPHRCRGVRGGARAGGSRRHLGVLALRGERDGGASMARPGHGLAPARPRAGAARADAGAGRPPQGRPHRVQLGRRHLVDHGLVLPPPVAHALVLGPHRGARGARRLGAGHLRRDGGLRARRSAFARGARAAHPPGRLQRGAAVHGLRDPGRGARAREGRPAVGGRRAGLRDQRAARPSTSYCCARCCSMPAETSASASGASTR